MKVEIQFEYGIRNACRDASGKRAVRTTPCVKGTATIKFFFTMDNRLRTNFY